jgi:hypothetical protein
MTKKERIERRLANRTKRNERKQLRKAKFDELMTRVDEVPDFPADGTAPNYAIKFGTYWPLAKAALQFAEMSKITGPKMDLHIQRIVELGDAMVNNPDSDADSEFILKIQRTWKVVRTILITITVFITKDKTDEKIDKLIEIGDWITVLDGKI